jgi:uncharacterized protein YbjT (DUF2867 family)
MKILLTGANGYIGTRLLPVLLESGYEVVCLVRDQRRFAAESDFGEKVQIVTGDLLQAESLSTIPKDIDAAYYLVHSMSSNGEDFTTLELNSMLTISSLKK